MSSVSGPEHLRYVDALRGWAVIGVTAVHVSQHVSDIRAPWRQLLDNGARGVQLFFLASAITLLFSWHRRSDGALAFFIRRLFRIGPLFWLAIVGYGLWYKSFDPILVLASAAFVHALHPATLMSAVPGGWSIGVEMLFYVVFPVLAGLIRNIWSAVLCYVLAFLAYRYGTQPLQQTLGAVRGDVANFLFIGPLPQAQVFLLGFVTYFAIRDLPLVRHHWIAEVLLPVCILGYGLLNISTNYWAAWSYFLPLLAFSIYLLANGAGARYAASTPIVRIGDASYGIYVWHFFVVDLAARAPWWAAEPLPRFLALFAVTLAGSYVCSRITQRFIERPMIQVGGRVAAMVRRLAKPRELRTNEG